MVTQASRSLTARIVHAAIMLGVIMMAAIAIGLRISRTFTGETRGSAILGIALVAGALGGFAGAVITRRTLVARGRAESVDAWWATNLGRAIVIWALAEAGAVIGLVLYLLQGTLVGLVLGGAGLAGRALAAPRRLENA